MPGCTDTAPPEEYTPEQLSRVLDALNAARKVSLNAKDAFWKGLPYRLKFEFNYSKWDYVPEK